MVQFFKVLDLSRILALLLLLAGLRILFGYQGIPVLIPEMQWMVIGERLNNGFNMYRDTIDGLEPLSASVYFLLNMVAGKNPIALQVFGALLVFIQALGLNVVLNSNRIFKENTSVPGLIYIVISALFFDFFTCSPVLLGITFLLFPLYAILRQVKTNQKDDVFLYTGIFCSLSALSFFPLVLFIPYVFLSLIIFTNTSPRKYFLILVGFILPQLVVLIYYFLRDSLDDYLKYFLAAHLRPQVFSSYLSYPLFWLLLILPCLLLLAGLVSVMRARGFTHVQNCTFKIIALWLPFASAIFLLARVKSYYLLWLFALPLCYFATQFFLLQKKWLWRELSFLFFTGGIVYLSFFLLKPPYYQAMVVNERSDLQAGLRNKRVLVLGPDQSYLFYNASATPYSNWEMSKSLFEKLDNYENVSLLYTQIKRDLPEAIVDQVKIAPKLFARMPALFKDFQTTDSLVYLRK